MEVDGLKTPFHWLDDDYVVSPQVPDLNHSAAVY